MCYALELEPDDEVIVPTFTIIACVNAVIRAGAKPVLVDCDIKTFNSISGTNRLVTPKTKAIMCQRWTSCRLRPHSKFSSEDGIKVIEDAAEVIGLNYKDKPCGSIGYMSTVSFLS